MCTGTDGTRESSGRGAGPVRGNVRPYAIFKCLEMLARRSGHILNHLIGGSYISHRLNMLMG